LFIYPFFNLGFPKLKSWVLSYNPVNIVALLAAQMGEVTKAFLKYSPELASLSIFGVLIISLPAYPKASHLWSSVRMKIIFGFFVFVVVFYFLTLSSHPNKKTSVVRTDSTMASFRILLF